MAIHEMNLRKEPFNKIVNGTKIVESRLYDEKRRLIKIGDKINFTCTDEQKPESVTVAVDDLFIYKNFATMMIELSSHWFGHEKSQDAINEINQFYSLESQREWGVLGIKISKIV